MVPTANIHCGHLTIFLKTKQSGTNETMNFRKQRRTSLRAKERCKGRPCHVRGMLETQGSKKSIAKR
eukprot:3689056-Amphidinium_carterae.1